MQMPGPRPQPRPAPPPPSPAVHGNLEQLRDAKGHGTHEVVAGSPVPVPHLHAEPALHVPRLQVAVGRGWRSEGPSSWLPTFPPWGRAGKPGELGPVSCSVKCFATPGPPEERLSPCLGLSKPRQLSQSPSPPGSSPSLSPGLSLQASPFHGAPLLPPDLSVCLSVSWLLFPSLPPTHRRHSFCVSLWVYVSSSESQGLPISLSDPCLILKW